MARVDHGPRGDPTAGTEESHLSLVPSGAQLVGIDSWRWSRDRRRGIAVLFRPLRVWWEGSACHVPVEQSSVGWSHLSSDTLVLATGSPERLKVKTC